MTFTWGVVVQAVNSNHWTTTGPAPCPCLCLGAPHTLGHFPSTSHCHYFSAKTADLGEDWQGGYFSHLARLFPVVDLGTLACSDFYRPALVVPGA